MNASELTSLKAALAGETFPLVVTTGQRALRSKSSSWKISEYDFNALNHGYGGIIRKKILIPADGGKKVSIEKTASLDWKTLHINGKTVAEWIGGKFMVEF